MLLRSIRHTCRALLVAGVLFALAAGCTEALPTAEGQREAQAVPTARATPTARTIPAGYWALDLSTPEQGAEAFINAWSNGDFVLAYQLLDIQAQDHLHDAASEDTQLPFVIADASWPPVPDDVELAHRQWWIARYLTAAWQAGEMEIDLGGAALRGETRPSAIDDRLAVDVGVVLSDGRPAEFRMTESVSGRWRVVQIGMPAFPVDRVFESGWPVVIGACDYDPRLELVEGADCYRLDRAFAMEGPIGQELEEEIARLRDEAGDDIAKQLENGKRITELINQVDRTTTRELCQVMQGIPVRWGDDEAPDLSAFEDRAAELTQTLCPGEPNRLATPDEPRLGRLQIDVDGVVAYHQLDLSSPAAAVVTFSDLMETPEPFLLALALDTDAQRLVSEPGLRYDVDEFSREDWDDFAISQSEHSSVPFGVFDAIMRRAAASDGYLIDARSVSSLGLPAELSDFGGRTDGVVIEASAPGHEGDIAFVVFPAPSGRWRVRQVASPPDAIDPGQGLFVVGG